MKTLRVILTGIISLSMVFTYSVVPAQSYDGPYVEWESLPVEPGVLSPGGAPVKACYGKSNYGSPLKYYRPEDASLITGDVTEIRLSKILTPKVILKDMAECPIDYHEDPTGGSSSLVPSDPPESGTTEDLGSITGTPGGGNLRKPRDVSSSSIVRNTNVAISRESDIGESSSTTPLPPANPYEAACQEEFPSLTVKDARVLEFNNDIVIDVKSGQEDLVQVLNCLYEAPATGAKQLIADYNKNNKTPLGTNSGLFAQAAYPSIKFKLADYGPDNSYESHLGCKTPNPPGGTPGAATCKAENYEGFPNPTLWQVFGADKIVGTSGTFDGHYGGMDRLKKYRDLTSNYTQRILLVGAGIDPNVYGILYNLYAYPQELEGQVPGVKTIRDAVQYLILNKGIANPTYDDIKTHFSNGIDDDGNGYIDDIIGWDGVNKDAYPEGKEGTKAASVIGGNYDNVPLPPFGYFPGQANAGDNPIQMEILKVVDDNGKALDSDDIAWLLYKRYFEKNWEEIDQIVVFGNPEMTLALSIAVSLLHGVWDQSTPPHTRPELWMKAYTLVALGNDSKVFPNADPSNPNYKPYLHNHLYTKAVGSHGKTGALSPSSNGVADYDAWTAPGENILALHSSWDGGPSSSSFSGTCAATANMAGAMATMRAYGKATGYPDPYGIGIDNFFLEITAERSTLNHYAMPRIDEALDEYEEYLTQRFSNNHTQKVVEYHQDVLYAEYNSNQKELKTWSTLWMVQPPSENNVGVCQYYLKMLPHVPITLYSQSFPAPGQWKATTYKAIGSPTNVSGDVDRVECFFGQNSSNPELTTKNNTLEYDFNW